MTQATSDPFGTAALDAVAGKYSDELLIHANKLEGQNIPLEYLIRSFEEMPLIEQTALKKAKGKVLDVGAGAGSHALYLQEKGVNVYAIDTSLGMTQAMTKRGVKNVVHGKVEEYKGEMFDTILCLMTGIGMAGNIEGLPPFISSLLNLLKPGGQILIDGADIRDLFDEDELNNGDEYYGEFVYTSEYKGVKSDPFPWLYIPAETLQDCCAAMGVKCKIIKWGDNNDYLAKIGA